MNDIHIITVATGSKYYFDYLLESCKNNGKELEIIGFGEKWKGFNWRNKLMLDYLNKLNPHDIVCFIDGYDVICVKNLSELKNDFINIKKRENCKIIVGNEIPKNIINEFINNKDFEKCKKLRLNAGTYIGYVFDVIEILSNIFASNPNLNEDDQKLMIKYCNLYPNDIYIDKECEIFLTICNSYNEIDNYITFNNNEISYKTSKPYFIHGVAGTFLDNIIIKLGYNYNKNVKYELLYSAFYKNKDIFIIIFLLILLIIMYKCK
jgi:hypothetical protein